MADIINSEIRPFIDISFNNTTEINSTIYFCRVPHNKFNYSSNPTYLSGSEIRVKNQAADEPVSYITTIGLYSADNELLAVAKLSEPIKKTPSTELNFRVRLDYWKMPFYKFEKDDIITSTIKAHPEFEFFIYNGIIYYNKN